MGTRELEWRLASDQIVAKDRMAEEERTGDLVQEYEARIAALERLIRRQALELM